MLAQKFLPAFHHNLIQLLCLTLLTYAFYYPAAQAGFVWDDFFIFVNDPLMTASDGLWRIWFDPGTERWNYWPLSRTVFWFQRQLWGLNPEGYHLVNISLHVLSAIVLWFALQQFHVRGAWWVGLLFAIHPVHVVSVAWVTELKNTLSGFFYLLSIWSYLHFDRHKSWGWYALSLGLFLFALLSKSATAMLPILLIVSRFWFQKKWHRIDFFCLIPFFLLALASGLFSIWMENQFIGTKTMEFSLSFPEKILVASHAAFFYLDKLLWPHSYMAIYPKWVIDLTQFHLYLPLVFWTIGFAVLVWKFQNWGRPFALSVSAFVISLFPVLGFLDFAGFSITYVWLHLVYLPSIPIFILLIQGGFRLFDHFQQRKSVWMNRLPWGIVILIFMMLGALTWHQSQLYQSEETLWSDTLRKNQSSWMTYHHLGNVYLDQGEIKQALEMFNQEILYNPNASRGYASRAIAYFRLKQYDQAIDSLNQAIQLRSNVARYYRDRGLIHFYMKNKKSMCADWKQTCQLGDCQNYHLAQKKRDCP